MEESCQEQLLSLPLYQNRSSHGKQRFSPADAKKARELGAEGIGLCRTEHMFFDPERIAAFREMICSDTEEEREVALDKILPYQQSDFKALYEAHEGCPVTIRFLDPPLHEFVPTEDADIEKLAKAKNKSVEEIKAICPICMLFLYFNCCTDNSLCLHLGNRRISNSKTASSVSHHWVELMK